MLGTSGSRRAGGFTLVELLVALAIGLILMTGIYQFFVAQRRTYSTQDEVNRLQADARVAEQLISKALQQTGAFSPTIGATVSMRGQVVLAASDHYLVVQADDPYRAGDQGIITADEVVAFAASKPGGTATERIGDDPTVTNKLARTVRVFYDQDTPPNGVDADEAVDVQIPLALGGPPYDLLRITPDPAGGTAPTLETIAGNVDNFVLHYYDQNGDPIVPLDAGGNPLPTYQPLGAEERARIRSVEIEVTMRTRNPDRAYLATFALPDNTVGTYSGAGVPQTGVSFTNDGYRRRSFRTRISPRNLSANSCGRITLTANPPQPTCPNGSTVTAVVIDQFGDVVSGQNVVFQLNPATGASFSTLPAVTTTSTATTNTNGEASVSVDYQTLSRAIAVSATAEVDCRPTGPQRFTLQNATSVGFVPGYADRMEIDYSTSTGPIDTYGSSTCGPGTGGSFPFTASGYDTCGNLAAPNPASSFDFSPSVGTLDTTSFTQSLQTFTLTLPDPGAGAFSSLAVDLAVDSGSTWSPSTIDVTGAGTTTFTAPYAGALFSVPLHPWPPAALYPNNPATWFAPLVPTAPLTAWEDCADLTLTSDPFRIVDCHDNPISDTLGAPYALTPTITGDGTVAVNGPSGFDYTLQYDLLGCNIPPAGSIIDTVSIDLTDGGTPLDTAGPQPIPVEGCATCAVAVVQNPTLCEQKGTVSVGGCVLTGKTMDIVLTTTSGTAVGSFGLPGTPVSQSITYTFGSSPILLDIYFTDASPGDQVTVTAYYPDQTNPKWQCSEVLTVSTQCSNVRVYRNATFLASAEILTNNLSCIGDISELSVEVEDCQIGVVGGGFSTLNEVRVQLEANGITYDEEYVDLKPSTNPAFLRSPTTGTASPATNTPLPVEADDGTNVSFDGVLRYPPASSLRLVVLYTDPVDSETCQTILDGLTSPTNVCFFNALASYSGADLPGPVAVHWGDVAVEGVVSIGAATAPTLAKRSTATLTGATEDRFLDVYVGMDAAGAGGYYQTGAGSTTTLDTRPFLLSDNLGNYFQHLSSKGIRTIAPELDYDLIKSLAQKSGSYWYTETTNTIGCIDGNPVTSGGGVTRCLTDLLEDPTQSFVFVDTFGPPAPTLSGSAINTAPGLPTFTLEKIATGAQAKLIYIAGSVRFTTPVGTGQPLAITSPPDADVHYLDNPMVGAPIWNPTEADLPIDPDTTRSPGNTTIPVNIRGGLYLEGRADFDGSPVIYGSLVAERGVVYTSGAPEIWYDYSLRSSSTSVCTSCGTRPVVTCGLKASPASLAVEQNLTSPVTISGLTGTLSASSANPAVATYDTSTDDVVGVGVGTTTITLTDNLQPLCPAAVGATVTPCVLSPAASPSTTLYPGATANVVVSQPVSWSVMGSSAVALSSPLPQSTGVVAQSLGSATVLATGGGVGCSDSVVFNVVCPSIGVRTSPADSPLVSGTTYTLLASGGTPPYTYTLTSGGGTLPPGTDTYTAGPAGPITIDATDFNGCSGTLSATVACPTITVSHTPPDVPLVSGNTYTLTAAGGNGPYTWALTSGTGTLTQLTGSTASFTPTASGTAQVDASDSYSCTGALGATVNDPGFFEVGEVTGLDENWVVVSTARTYTDPIVVAKPLSYNDTAPAAVRIRNVTGTGFEIRVQEYDYLDGVHPGGESVSYIVMERGTHSLPDGTLMEAGSTTATNENLSTVTFAGGFSAVPVVVSAVVTVNEADTPVTRNQLVSTSGFQVKMQEQESNANNHATETVHFIAWEPSSGTVDGRTFEVGTTPDAVTHNWYTINFSNTYGAPPLFVADMQVTDGGDTANLRWRNKSTTDIQVQIDEEQSANTETNHTNEIVGYMVFSP